MQPEALRRAGRTYATWLAICESMTPREQAEAAWHPGARYTVDELEAMICEQRGLDLPRSA